MNDHYNPDQPRAAAGTPNGGQWVDMNVLTEQYSKASNALKMAASDLTDDDFLKTKKLIEDSELLVKRAAEAMPETQALAEQIAGMFDGQVSPPNLKKLDRVIEKAKNEYGGNVDEIKDAARNTISSYNHVDDIMKVFESMKLPEGATGPGIVRIKKQTAEKDALGYSGNIINYRSKNGLITEIQVNTPDIIYAKESEKAVRGLLGNDGYERIKAKYPGIEGGRGHKMFDEWRKLSYNKDENKIRMAQLESESTEYYKKFR